MRPNPRCSWLAVVPLIALSLACCSPASDLHSPVTAAEPIVQPRAFSLQFDTASARSQQAPAYQLTTSDGTGLRLVSLNARVAIEDPLALTELHFVFENPQPRTIEGRFELEMPKGAAISRFAMKINDSWQEGEVVERQRARRVFEDFLHRRQDPALLEHDAGNRFRARVFPIPANGRKELIVTYSQELGTAPDLYRLPLVGLPQLDELQVTLVQATRGTSNKSVYTNETAIVHAPTVGASNSIRRRAFTPTADVVIHEQTGARELGIRRGAMAMARVELTAAPGKTFEAAPVERVVVLLDTSASQTLRLADTLARLQQLVDHLQNKRPFELHVLAFDQEVVDIYSGPSGGFGLEQHQRVLQRGAFGATDLAKAMQTVRARNLEGARIIVVSDGVATAGVDAPGRLGEVAAELRAAGAHRVDAMVPGSNSDRATLRALTVPTKPEGASARAGMTLDAQWPTAKVANSLQAQAFTNVAIDVPGSRWLWPRSLDGAQPGDTVTIYAEMANAKNMHVHFQGAALADKQINLASTPGPLLERAWFGARVEHLLAQYGHLRDRDHHEQRQALKQHIVELSTHYRVLTPFTALLVLESEWDYERYGIERQALTDILSVGPNGVDVLARTNTSTAGSSRRSQEPTLSDAWDSPVTERLAGQDTDGDGIADSHDSCPSAPEALNGFEDEDGCPDAIPMQVARFTGTIRGIHFPQNSAKIQKKSAPVLDRAASVLQEFPGIVVEVSGHASAGERQPDKLAKRRAQAVARYLRAHGIDSKQVVVRGAGVSEPIDTNETKKGRANNRRIEFSLRSGEWVRRNNAVTQTWAPAHSGKYQAFRTLLAQEPNKSLVHAKTWQASEPGNVIALIALAEALEASGQTGEAARAYGSIIDLYPSRADLRRHAGQRLESLGVAGLELAADTYKKAVAQRPDHPSSHRLYAYTLVRLGRLEEAFEAIVEGHKQEYPQGRFRGVKRILSEDIGLIAAAWAKAEPTRRAEIETRAHQWGQALASEPSLRFVLSWETDANDVDFHIRDGAGGHASFRQPALESGGELYADVTTGYGPECFAIDGEATAFPYTLNAHYYRKGPMGFGMGTVQVQAYDGKGNLRFADHPFVIMNDNAAVDLGTIAEPLFEDDTTGRK